MKIYQQYVLNALIAFGIGWCYLQFENSYLRLLLSPILAALFFRNFSLMHDASHHLISQQLSKNEFFGMISGAFCMLPYVPWKRSHLDHHFWSGNIEKDPVMGFLRTYPKMSVKSKIFLDIAWKSWFPILGIVQNIVFWLLAFKTCLNNKNSPRYVASFVIPIIFWVSVFMLTSIEFKVFLLGPALFLYFVAVEVVNLPHHLQMQSCEGENKLAQWDQHLAARTCIYPDWISKHLTLNFNYHVEHHMFPDCPWYKLPELSGLVQNALGVGYTQDPYLQWIVKNKKKGIQVVLFGSEDLNNDKKAA